MVLQCFVGDELVDEQPVVLHDAVAHQGNQMAMVNAADDLHFGSELPFSLSTPDLELLHRDLPPVRQRALVHRSEPALADVIVAREPTGYAHQLVVRELPAVAAIQALCLGICMPIAWIVDHRLKI